MNTLRRFMAKYRILAKILFGIFLCGTYSILLYWLGAPIWVYALVWLFLLFFNSVYIDTCADKLLLPTLQALNEQCDPYPFLREVEEQMNYRTTEAMWQRLMIHYALALRNIGDYTGAWDILHSLNIDKSPSILPAQKLIYYNNLADILHLLNRYDEADIWYEKSLQIYRDLPENKLKLQLAETVNASSAEALYRKGAYEETKNCLDGLPAKNQRTQVEFSLLYARCCIALGDTETAKVRLSFVIVNGNKLHCVTEAKQLLETL